MAWSPYRIQAVEAKADRSAVVAGATVAIAARVKAAERPGDHVLNFRVYGPDGKERRHYGDTLIGRQGQAKLTLRTALNDAKGTWRVKAADLASGAVGEAGFEVK